MCVHVHVYACVCACMGGYECVLCVRVYVCVRVGTRLSHPGQPSHVLSGLTWFIEYLGVTRILY